MKLPKILALDFETKSIESRPAYPPEPIGCSLKRQNAPSTYLAWGHKTGNNIAKSAAIKMIREQVEEHTSRDVCGIVMHHGKFDCDVMETHLGVKIPEWKYLHDTMYLLFLHDPNLKHLDLKSAAREILGWPADEKNAIAEWMVRNQPVPGIKLSRGPKSEFYFMKFLEFCPGDILGPYADGDTDRTMALFEKLYPRVIDRGMEEAYTRERRLMPVLLDMERRGVRVALDRLRTDVVNYQAIQIKIDAWLIKRLNASKFINLDSDDALVAALVAAGVADVELMGLTKTGKVATNKVAIENGVTDKQVAAVLKYRAQLHTCMVNFLEPWLKMAEASGGLIFTNWNQVRGSGKGARTGRLSSTPPFMNIPKGFATIFAHEKKGLPTAPVRGLIPLPLCRSYIVPYQADHVLIDRDWNQNEIRLLAHFGDGELLERYKKDPWLDMHDTVKDDLLKLAGVKVTRAAVKTINFGIIYCMGVTELARRLEMPIEEARALRKSVTDLYPEIDDLYKTMRALARGDEPLVTLGGRENFCERPTKDKDGKLIDWSYKMINTLVQGSAGDGMKTGLIRYADTAPKGHYPLILVHDQMLCSVPRSEVVLGHDAMRAAMESVELDVPLLTDGKWSPTNWAELKPYDERGVVVAEGLPEQKHG